MHDIYSLKTITVSATCFGVNCAIIKNFLALYLKPSAVTQLSAVTAVVMS
jgi:hypothetical protein